MIGNPVEAFKLWARGQKWHLSMERDLAGDGSKRELVYLTPAGGVIRVRTFHNMIVSVEREEGEQ